jgi:hypothetical protein
VYNVSISESIFPKLHTGFPMSAKYNGWSNRETWNVALWISNTESLYNIARTANSYTDFVRLVSLYGERIDRYEDLYTGEGSTFHNGTPDGIAWNSKALNRRELSTMIREIRA